MTNFVSEMKRILYLSILLLCTFSCSLFRGKNPDGQIAVQKDTVYPLGFCTDSFRVVSGTVSPGDGFAAWVTRLGLPRENVYGLVVACDSVFDVMKFRAGNTWNAYYSDSTTLNYIVYDNSRVVQTVFQCKDSLAVWKYTKPVETFVRTADVTIESSLWNSMLEAGAPAQLVIDLSDIYAWTVDFFALQKGDRFRVLYSEDICQGSSVGVSGIWYSEFIRGNTVLPAVYFDQNDGGNKYWNQKGESMRKAFLKAPLKFSRISSGFSYHRVHPVHGIVRPHTAVDYAAPTGTPVRSIGDGTVLSAGWGSGGAGNTVKIRHNSVYTTSYMHLSKIAVKAGQRVSQGQVIGYVGMTGTATGPHLDFRVWKNGTPINPLTLESPPSEPVKKENLAALDSVCTSMKHRLDSLLTK